MSEERANNNRSWLEKKRSKRCSPFSIITLSVTMRSPTGGQDLPVAAELEGVDGVRVSLQVSDHDAVADVPEQHAAVRRPRRHELPVGGEGERVDRTLEDGRVGTSTTIQC